jgi:hypothetical protein
LGFSEGDSNGATVCLEIPTTEDSAFNKYRVFTVQIELEAGSASGITLPATSIEIHISNDDSKSCFFDHSG